MLKFKRFLPTSIFQRFLLIITIPVIILQSFIGYFFLQQHWYKVSQTLTDNLVHQIALVLDVYDGKFNGLSPRSLNGKTQYLNRLLQYEQLSLSFTPKAKLPKVVETKHVYGRIFDFYYLLKQSLREYFAVNYQLQEQPTGQVLLQLEHPEGLITLGFDKHLLVVYSVYTFMILSLILMILTLVASILFLKKQVDPVKDLARAVALFGKGEQNIAIKARGAAEIRAAILAFIQMQERVTRQVNQHTLMLASISHDLRTPLTRMRLQLAMLKATPELNNLKDDLADMENMLNDYLEFVKGSNGEAVSSVRFKHFIHNIVSEYRSMGQKVSLTSRFDGRMVVQIKRNSLKRAITNLINNGLKFGTRVWVCLSSTEQNIILTICDNGTGVSNEEKDKIFRAFYRSDLSRNLDISGTGLGTTIAKDIIISHGGRIELGDNHPSGLMVTIYLPK